MLVLKYSKLMMSAKCYKHKQNILLKLHTRRYSSDVSAPRLFSLIKITQFKLLLGFKFITALIRSLSQSPAQGNKTRIQKDKIGPLHRIKATLILAN